MPAFYQQEMADTIANPYRRMNEERAENELELEGALAAYEKQVAPWSDAARRAAGAVQKLEKAVQSGNVRDIEKLRAAALGACQALAERAAGCPPFDFDGAAYLENGYLDELAQAAAAAKVTLFVRDGIVFCYPVLVRPEPELGAVRIDKKLETTLRPAALAAILKKLQAREPKARPERFIEALLQAYLLVRRDEAWIDIPLTEIYAALTLQPGSEREYTLLDFARDVYFLDISGVSTTRRGYRMDLPASTSTRDKKTKPIPFVDRQGREKLYATLKFTPPE